MITLCYTIFDITFDTFKTIQSESLLSFLSTIDNLNDRDIRFISSNTRLSYFAIRDEIIVLKMDFIKFSKLLIRNIYSLLKRM